MLEFVANICPYYIPIFDAERYMLSNKCRRVKFGRAFKRRSSSAKELNWNPN